MNIEIDSLDASYGGPMILRGISLGVSAGHIVSLIGANGSGKSTLLRVMSRSMRISSGRISVGGKDIFSYSRKELARKMAFLPQSRNAPEDMTVHDLVSCGRYPHRRARGAWSRKGDDEAVGRAIAMMRMEDLMMRHVSTLSGGERQRAWIAMNIAQEPDIMLLDEPTTFLDVCHQFEVMDMIRNLNRELGVTVVMALHDLNHAAHYSHRIVSMKSGAVYKEGTPDEVISENVLREVFGIKSRILREDGVPYFIAAGVAGKETKAS